MEYVDSTESALAAAPKYVETAFNRLGQKITGKNEKIYAKVLVKGLFSAYYIKTYNGELFDPLGTYAKREDVLETKLIETNKNVFDFYMVYLQTNRSIYFTKAQRAFISSR